MSFVAFFENEEENEEMEELDGDEDAGLGDEGMLQVATTSSEPRLAAIEEFAVDGSTPSPQEDVHVVDEDENEK